MMRRARGSLGTLIALGVLFISRAALACPACLGGGRSTELLKLGSLLVLVPFAVAAVVFFVLRSEARSEARR